VSGRRHRAPLVLTILALALAACGGSPGPTPAGTPAVTVEISSTASVFDRNELTVIADAPFAVRFQNFDALPHNVSVRGGAAPLVGEIFSGPAERTYYFASLPQGSYTFLCDVHPDMKGTLLSN
jgi:plastocyanin